MEGTMSESGLLGRMRPNSLMLGIARGYSRAQRGTERHRPSEQTHNEMIRKP